uniref:Uncharacterized protein n=1 Tax=Siphoviridae sp. ctFiA6 TaxID=2823573 RepID=A0A8S5LGF9_9CAUD|nr:MAG TPA: hypothetical protein [Siphoviridae sp. ctFiA6]
MVAERSFLYYNIYRKLCFRHTFKLSSAKLSSLRVFLFCLL